MKTNEEIVGEFKRNFCATIQCNGEYTTFIKTTGSHEIIDWLRTTLEEVRREEVERCIQIVEKEYIRYSDTGKVQESEYNYSLLNAVNSLKALTPTKTDKQ